MHQGREAGRGQVVAGDRETVHGWPLLDRELVVAITQTGLLIHPTYGYALEEAVFTAWDRDDLAPFNRISHECHTNRLYPRSCASLSFLLSPFTSLFLSLSLSNTP